jgi:hypothetical protein
VGTKNGFVVTWLMSAKRIFRWSPKTPLESAPWALSSSSPPQAPIT